MVAMFFELLKRFGPFGLFYFDEYCDMYGRRLLLAGREEQGDPGECSKAEIGLFSVRELLFFLRF